MVIAKTSVFSISSVVLDLVLQFKNIVFNELSINSKTHTNSKLFELILSKDNKTKLFLYNIFKAHTRYFLMVPA